MDGSEDLWELVQLILPSSSLTANELESQLGNYQDKLLNLFQHKVPASSSRCKRAQEAPVLADHCFSSSSPLATGRPVSSCLQLCFDAGS
jgi:hypothetical protein